jgi:hypothetical protein
MAIDNRSQGEPRHGARRTVEATINYVGPMTYRAKFHAQDHGRDNLRFDPHRVTITDARTLRDPPTLEREGLRIAPHRSAIRDFRDAAEVREKYPRELERLIMDLTGAVRAKTLGGGGLVRYTERSPYYKTGMNTQPARFPHVDFTPNTSPGLSDNVFGSKPEKLERGQRLVGYNIWRVVSEPPQDVPLAVVDSRTVAREDLLPADGVYDQGDDPSKWMELEAYLLRYNPAHRWLYYRDMRPDEVLIFRGYDNGTTRRAGVPHSAFDDPSCPPGAPPRVSIEARVYAIYD